MEQAALKQVQDLAFKKQKIFQKSPFRYLLRSMLASMFIGFGVIVAFKSGNFFYLEQSPLAFPIAALTFGAAIILITYGGGDLFTGNTFYFSYTAFQRKINWSDVSRLLLTSYFGNILGAIFFALFIFSTGLFSDQGTTGFLMSVAEKKVQLPPTELFFRGILCNWLVCLAFFIPMRLEGDGAKLFTMMLFVFCFFISGYEHSIANMCTFAIAFVSNPPETFTLAGVIHNLIPVTLGNMIGGGVLMGWMYYYVNKPFMEDEK